MMQSTQLLYSNGHIPGVLAGIVLDAKLPSIV